MLASKRQYWLWVTKPAFYLDEDGNERADLDPAIMPDAEHWWTCREETQMGDLALLYRTAPRSDIAYLLQATSEAIVIEPEYQMTYGWSYRCDCQVLYKFPLPVTRREIQESPDLEEWSALRGNFQKAVWDVDEVCWAELVQLVIGKNPEFSRFYDGLEHRTRYQRPRNERQLERKIAADPSILSRFGFDLELIGQQYVCSPVGRIDLLCYEESKRRYVVIELKDVKATQSTYGQISSYMGWIRTNMADRDEGVHGLVISRGYDVKFDACLHASIHVQHVDVSQL